MKVKLLAVLTAISALFIGAVLWRTDSFVYGDRLSWVEAQNRTQLGSINHALAVELKSLQRVMTSFNVDNFRKETFNWSSVAPFYAAVSFNVNEGEFDPQNILVKENSKAAGWSKEFIKASFGRLTGNAKELRYYVTSFQDSNKGHFVAVAFLDGKKAFALIGNGETFQSLIDAQKGSLSSFSIVNSAAVVVGHSEPDYLGTVMKDDPLYADAKKNGSSHGSGVYKLAGGQEIYGRFEQIPGSNLLLISSAPVNETMQGRHGLWWEFLLLGCGLVLVGSAGVLGVVGHTEKKMESLEAGIIAAKQMTMNAPPAPKTVIVDPAAAQEDRNKTSMRVASALSHEMSGPLTSILGHAQIILSKNPDNEITASAESILRETRTARSVVDKILVYAGEDVKEKASFKLEGPVARALKNLEMTLQKKGIKLTKSFQSFSTLPMNVDNLTMALQNILINSIESMERMSKKEIRIDLKEEEGQFILVIEDTGEGIEAVNLKKIFDPFYTTRAYQNHMGLGLSVALGVLREHGAEINVFSERGRGTKFQITFPKNPELAYLKAPEKKSKEAPVEEFVLQKKNHQLDDDLAMKPPPAPKVSVQSSKGTTSAEEMAAKAMAEAQFNVSEEPIDEFNKELLEEDNEEMVAVRLNSKDQNFSNDNEQFNDVNEVLNQDPMESKKGGLGLKSLTANLAFDEDKTIATHNEDIEGSTATSPLDFNIENLLELPPAPPMDLSEKTQVLAEQDTVTEPLMQIDAEVNDQPFAMAMDKPSAKSQSSSKLDSYKVEIRRPGKRP